MNQDALERFLNSDWMLGLTQIAARRRWLAVTLVGAGLWAFFAYLLNPPSWDPALSAKFLFYPFQALFSFPIFPIILLFSVFFGLVLFLAPRYLPDVSPRIFRRAAQLVAVLFGILWALLAYRAHPPDLNGTFTGQLVAYPFEALFAPNILRHVLLAGLAFWLAFRIAAIYLDDIYELQEVEVAERFILQAAFASQYSQIDIRNAEIPPEQRDSTLARVGGPGWVRVHLENAALFETPDGVSRIIGPTGQNRRWAVSLGAFERLRDIIDLRDQSDSLTVESRTSDGIWVRAEDVQIVVSVYRDNQPSTLDMPYPYDSEALLRLFYIQEKGVVKEAMKSLVVGELARFISQHSLSEFLAAAGGPDEMEQVLTQDEALSETTRAGVGGNEQKAGVPPAFVTRSQMITDLFAAEFATQARRRGVELKWIGIGNWVTPSQVVPQRHLSAWRLSIENLVRGSQRELDRVRNESERLEILRLVQEAPIQVFRRSSDLPPWERMRRVIIAYHGRINDVYELYQRENYPSGEREQIRNVLVFLSRFTTRRPIGPSMGGMLVRGPADEE